MNSKHRNRLFHLILLALFGAIMYAGKWALQSVPNIHPVGFFIMAITAVYRTKALVSVYIFVLLSAVLDGVNVYWMPYIYVWAILWGLAMLIPKKLVISKWGMIICPIVCGLFGLAFGTLCAPLFGLLSGYTELSQYTAWIAQGIGFDVTHCLSNIGFGLLVPAFAALLDRLEKQYR